MKVYTCTRFEGVWPTGTAAVIVAVDKTAALQRLNRELENRALKQTTPLTIEDLVEVTLHRQGCYILNDGDY